MPVIKKIKKSSKKPVAKKQVKKVAKKLVKKVKIAKVTTKPISLEALFAEIDKVFADEKNNGNAYAFSEHVVATTEKDEVEVSLDAIFKDILDQKSEDNSQKPEADEVNVELSQLFDEIFANEVATQLAPVSLDELFCEVFPDEQKVTPAYSSVITSTLPVESTLEKEGMEEMFRAIQDDEIQEVGVVHKVIFSFGVAVVAIAIAFSWFHVTAANFSQQQADSDALVPIELQAEWQRVRNEARQHQADIQKIISQTKSDIQNAQ